MCIRDSNHHEDFERQFKIEYDDIERAIMSLYDRTGRVAPQAYLTVFHSHPFGSGQPSPEDIQGLEEFAKQMDGHPLWTPTQRHFIYSLWDHSWWWYDLIGFGRITWAWR